MKHSKLAKLLANVLGFALVIIPATMAFAGCNKSVNKGVDLYSVDIRDYDGISLSHYDNAIEYQNQLNSTTDNSTKCLSTEKAEAFSSLMYSLGDEYAQKQLVFDKVDENGEKVNSFNQSYSLLDAYISSKVLNNCIYFTIYETNFNYSTSFGDFLNHYYKDEIDATLDSNDYVSEKDFINGYVSFLNGYYDNAKDYVLSNYTRYEDLTDEQISQVLSSLKSCIDSTARDYYSRHKNKILKYKQPVSYDTIGVEIIPTAYLIAGTRSRIETIIQNSITNIYPADFMYFEQPMVDYWQACIDPLFQENFGYTWTDCVKLTENPDLHPINWDGGYGRYFTLIGMTLDDLPMPTIS